MKEYLNKIEIIPAENVLSITDTTLNLIDGKSIDKLICQNDVVPDERSAEKQGSLYYSQTLNIYIDKSLDSFRANYLDRKVIVRLFTSDDEVVLFGNLDYPARCNLIPHLNSDALKITNESAYPLLS